MENVSLYRKTLRFIKGGAKRLEEANKDIQAAANVLEIKRLEVRRQIDFLRSHATHRS